VLGEYTYNGKGQRVKKVADGRTTIYHYDVTGNLIQETDQNGGVIASHIYAGTNRLAMVKPDGSIYYYHNDHLGTPLAMTDAEGNIVWKAAYDPFGQAHVDPASTVTNNFRFPGQYYDEESGLHYNWYRYYDPRTGRYLTADPVGIQGGTNHLYGYVENNPILFIDPKGLEIWICNRKTRWGVGNHAYFWDDRNGACCGMKSTKNCSEKGKDGGDDCRVVHGSKGREDELLKCCKDTADQGPWVPPINDCHEALDDCLEKEGLQNPGAPGGRLGPPCDPCRGGASGSW
jgi:RHS repeat-associated protein